MGTQFKLEEVKMKLAQSEREVMVLLSNQAQNYFLQSWRNQAFDGESWKEVQRRTEGTKAYKYPKEKGLQRRTAPILVGSGWKKRGGTLRRAVSTMSRTAENIGPFKVRMIVDLPYAKVINEGGRNMPQRQFVGQTAELTRMQTEKIENIISRIWKI